jgi:hypothetical protein
VFLIAVFGLCSVDLFLRSGRSSRPSGALALYSLLLDENQAPGPEAIALSVSVQAEPENVEETFMATVVYGVKSKNHLNPEDWFANISK